MAEKKKDIPIGASDTVAEALDGVAKDIGRRALSMAAKEERERLRRLVVTALDYINEYHQDNPQDVWVAKQLGLKAHTVNDSWRVWGRSLPDDANMLKKLLELCTSEAQEHWPEPSKG